jgi:hypothetical protein
MKSLKFRQLCLFCIGLLLTGLLTTQSSCVWAQVSVFFAQTHEVQIYVAVNGRNSNPGTITAPVASIDRAQTLARQATITQRKNVTVYLRGGLYRLARTLEFNEQDSGAEGYKVTYKAYAKERPILSGGVPITGWRPASNGLYTTKINFKFRQLYINGRRVTRARFPNGNNYLRLRQWYLDAKPDINNTREANRVLIVNAADFQGVAIPTNGSTEIVIQRDWAQNRLRIESFQLQGNKGLVGVREPERQSAFGSLYAFKYPLQAYHLENSLSFLDVPGEWFLDPDGDLFYRPRPGETVSSLKAVAPRLETLLRIHGLQSETLNFKD